MDVRQITLVQQSFAQVLPHMPKVTRVLYDELFAQRPDLKPLFVRDIRDQRKRLLKALDFIVGNLHRPDLLIPFIEESAIRHVKYGVQTKDYRDFNDALLFALAAAFGDDFDKDTKQAWRGVFSTLSAVMIEATFHKEVAEEI